jgi:hypothetical protein
MHKRHKKQKIQQNNKMKNQIKNPLEARMKGGSVK